MSRHSLIRYQNYRRLVADVRPTDGLGQLSLSRSVSGQDVMEVSRCVQTLVDQISDLQETHGRPTHRLGQLSLSRSVSGQHVMSGERWFSRWASGQVR